MQDLVVVSSRTPIMYKLRSIDNQSLNTINRIQVCSLLVCPATQTNFTESIRRRWTKTRKTRKMIRSRRKRRKKSNRRGGKRTQGTS